MRTITIRQLDQNLFKELEDLPVSVTSYGKDYCIITSDSEPTIKESVSKPNPWSNDPYQDRPVLVHTRVDKIVAKVKKSETCPHMISVGGNCSKCVGGIAK